MMQSLSIAKQFSRSPAGRYKTDGPHSGEEFREKYLIPALSKEGSIEIDIDGVLGFGSSFLEEAFGGLVRRGISAKELHQRMKIRSRVKIYEQKIWKYVDEA